MSELSNEMKLELTQELRHDAQRILEDTNMATSFQKPLAHGDLEQLVYITEQIRLKLRLLGAPRIYQ